MRTHLTIAGLAAAAFSAPNYQLVWSDEFDYTGLPNATKWGYDVGGNGWGNGELQFYKKANPKNSWVDNGTLKINVRQEDTSWTNSKGVVTTNHYSSARLLTKGLATWKYGRFEARMKLPKGRGMWPAFWMIPPDNNAYGNWPTSGEIDILENWGIEQTTMWATVHMSGNASQNGYTLTEYPNDSFHTYALDWRPDTISMSVDGKPYFQYVNPKVGYTKWPFDQPFYIILNAAVDGKTYDGSATLPQSMVVDYVRVYQDTILPKNTYSVALSQTIGGTVSVSPVKASYNLGDKIQIKAIAASGYVFSSWTAGTTTKLATDSLSIAGNTILSAAFAKIPDSFTVNLSQTLGGSILVSPVAAKYPANAKILIKAVPNPGFLFKAWTLGAPNKLGTDSLVVTANTTLSAAFVTIPDSVTVTLSQTTGGTISISPVATKYAPGSKIKINAVPTSGYSFARWTTGTTSLLAMDSLVLDSSKILTASFVTGQLPITISLLQTAGGTISVSPIKASYQPGEKVLVQATALNGFKFVGWISGTTSNLAADSIMVDSIRSLSALFAANDQLVPNGGFELGWKGWTTWNDASLNSTYLLRNGAACLRSGAIGPQGWYAQITYSGFPVTVSTDYEISFVAKASSKRTFTIFLSQAQNPYGALTARPNVVVDTVRARQTLVLGTGMSENSSRVEINFANDTAELCLDSLSVKRIPNKTASLATAPLPKNQVRIARQEIFVTTAGAASWTLRSLDGTLVRSGIFPQAGTHAILGVPAGIGILTLDSRDSQRQTLRISTL